MAILNPKNLQYILRWYRENRPVVDYDNLQAVLVAADRGDTMAQGILLLLTTGFEAGRLFQRENPGAPEGLEAYTPDELQQGSRLHRKDQ